MRKGVMVAAVLVTVAVTAGACEISIGSPKPAPVYIVTTTTAPPGACPNGQERIPGNKSWEGSGTYTCVSDYIATFCADIQDWSIANLQNDINNQKPAPLPELVRRDPAKVFKTQHATFMRDYTQDPYSTATENAADAIANSPTCDGW